MNNLFNKIKKSFCGKDIVIIGKAKTMDFIDSSLLKSFFVVNVNDSETIFSGDLCIVSKQSAAQNILKIGPKCSFYAGKHNYGFPSFYSFEDNLDVDENIGSQSDFLNEFLGESFRYDFGSLLSTIKVINCLSKKCNYSPKVYLLGFDLSSESGYSQKAISNDLEGGELYLDKSVKKDEFLFKQLLKNREKLSMQLLHVGNNSFSLMTPKTFNFMASMISIQKPKKLETSYAGANPSANRVEIVAEITTNHFGDINRLTSMIYAAKSAGADFVKFQKRNVETFYSKEQLKSTYISPFGETFEDYRKGIELNEDEFKVIDSVCRKIGIKWFASILDIQSFNFIMKFNPEIIKLPSTISLKKDFIEEVAMNYDGDIVVSMGFTDAKYEEFILNKFAKNKKLYLLQCTSSYPTKPEDVNIGVINRYKRLAESFKNVIPGFSSHDIGNIASIMSVAAGARMIEKHVKIGDNSWAHFDDVALDLIRGDLDIFIESIRNAEKIYGVEDKFILDSEHHKY